MICGRSLRFVYAVKLYAAILSGDRLRFLCGDDTVAVAMHFAMKNGQICFSLRKFLAISPAIQKIASDCGCDAAEAIQEPLPLKQTMRLRATSSFIKKHASQSPDLPLPHGLAPSETMVWDHGLIPSPSPENLDEGQITHLICARLKIWSIWLF